MRTLVTGHQGYIGVHLVRLLKESGHHVTGCDLGLFDGCAWDAIVPADIDLRQDFRTLTVEDLRGYDAVLHLAAISNDPMGDLDPAITYEINRDGSVELARRSRAAGVRKFLFSGSCSIYGQGASLDLDESAPLNPVSAYAESKIETERQVRPLAGDSFSPVFLRNATAYGASPMLRLDLVVNNLLATAFATGQIRVMSDGSPWRPLVHCEDIARAFVAFLEAPAAQVHNMSVNVGGNSENFQVKDVVQKVKHVLPDSEVVFTGEVGADPRNYRVKFDLLAKTLPDFRLKYTLDLGIEELLKQLKDKRFSKADLDGNKFIRLRTLKDRLDRLRLPAGKAPS